MIGLQIRRSAANDDNWYQSFGTSFHKLHQIIEHVVSELEDRPLLFFSVGFCLLYRSFSHLIVFLCPVQRGPTGAATTTVRQPSTLTLPVNLLAASSSASSTGRPVYVPVSSVNCSAQPLPGSPQVSAAVSRLSFAGQLVPGSPLTSASHVIPGSPLSAGAMIPSSPLTPAGQSVPNSPVASVGQKTSGTLPACAGQTVPGSSLRVVMAPVAVSRQPTPSSVVQPVLAAVLRQPVSGVQLVWNQQSNPAFMTGGVIVQVGVFYCVC
jgi:hypothetical protein